ncbi:Gfo/Idh/MocA family protein [Paenibacillus elgii]
MKRNIRFALVGTGVIAMNHAKAIAAHPEAELVAIAEKDADRGRAFAAEHGIGQVFGDYERMLKQDDIDVICVCVPSGLHGDVTIAAAQAGKHVLCEKPLEIRREKMDEMITACRKHGVKLGTVFQKRTTQQAAIVGRAIREGKLGKLVLGDVYMKYYRSPEYYWSADWRGTWAVDGGGALMNQGVHGIDLLLSLMGDVESVFAYAAPLVRDIEVEDTAVATVKYKNGAFGVIQGTTSVYPGTEMRAEIHGELGSIVFADSGFKVWKFAGSDEEAPQTAGKAEGSSDPRAISGDGHYILVDDMIGAIREDRDPLISGEEGRKAVDLILAIYESARTRQEVKL